MKVSILGQGAWGSALAVHVAQAHSVRWWGRDPEVRHVIAKTGRNEASLPGIPIPSSITLFDSLDECVRDCDWMILAVSVGALTEVAMTLRESGTQIGVLWGCKGMMPETGQLPSEILDGILGSHPRRAALSGPTFAEELATGLPAAAVIAAATRETAEEAARLLHHGAFRIYPGTDLVGTQLGGAVKNVLAIAAGIADGLNLGDNARAALITRGLRELSLLGSVLGAQPDTLNGLSGMGDILLTCTSPRSRNFRFGHHIGAGLTPDQAATSIGQVIEGWGTTFALYQLSRQHGLELPICEQVYRVLTGDTTPSDSVATLLARDSRPEMSHV